MREAAKKLTCRGSFNPIPNSLFSLMARVGPEQDNSVQAAERELIRECVFNTGGPCMVLNHIYITLGVLLSGSSLSAEQAMMERQYSGEGLHGSQGVAVH